MAHPEINDVPPRRDSTFRPIQYLGSKARLLDQIEATVELERCAGRPVVCDLFAGTGVVTRRLARSGPVIGSDVQEYSRVLTNAQLNPRALSKGEISAVLSQVVATADEMLSRHLVGLINYEKALLEAGTSDAAVSDLVEFGSIAAWNGRLSVPKSVTRELDQLLAPLGVTGTLADSAVLTGYYGGVYFSYAQAVQLDAMCRVAHACPSAMRDTVLSAALSTASDLVSSVGGHFAQPIRLRDRAGSVKASSVSTLRLQRKRDALPRFQYWLSKWSNLPPPEFSGTARRADFRNELDEMPEDVGVVYADPPYTRDHYSRFYHVLETMARGDNPGLSTTRTRGNDEVSRGLYRKVRHQSPFSIVGAAPQAFQELCEALVSRQVPLVLSYSPIPETDKPRARVMAMPDLLDILNDSFRNVRVTPVEGVGHAKLNAKRLNAGRTYDAEVLITCRTR